MKKLVGILVALLTCLVVVAGFLIWHEVFSGSDDHPNLDDPTVITTNGRTDPEPTWPTGSEVPERTTSKETTTVTENTRPTETEKPTERPTETTKATEKPTETSKPTEKPTEAEVIPTVDVPSINGNVTNSGSFVSDSGSGMDLQVKWSSFTDSDGSAKVRLDAYLNVNSIYVSERYGGLVFTVGGVTKSVNTSAISHTGSRTSILIGSVIMDKPEGSATVTASWAFKGTYNNIQMDNITATATIS